MTTAATTQRPVPVADKRSAPYWEAAARHELVIARCSRCQAFSHPPEDICARCGSVEPDFRFVPVSGKGRVRSWTVVRQALLPGFAADVPFLIVDVELADHPEVRITGRLLDGMEAPVRLDAPVRAAFEDVAEGVAVPAFVLETGA